MTRPDGEDDIERLLRLAGARPVAPAGAQERVHAAARARWRSAVAARRRRIGLFWASGLAAAAAAILILIAPSLRRASPSVASGFVESATLTRVVGTPRTEPPVRQALEPGAAIPDDSELETGPEDRAALLLSDGTSLRLDRDTRIRLLRGPEIELEAGAVYALSAEPARLENTFRIRTALGTVRDVGTRFQVRLAGDVLKVTVRSGIARLERGGVSQEAATGTQLIADAGGAVAVRSAPGHGPEWDWTMAVAPEFEIEGRTLGEFLGWAADEQGLRVEFEDPAAKPHAVATILHGSVRGMNPDEAVAAVLPTCGLRHSIREEVLLIQTVSR
jgi:ferric-dicitrate binding protein FerR (iron transport regulator)